MTWNWMFPVFFTWLSKAAGTKCFLTSSGMVQGQVLKNGLAQKHSEMLPWKTAAVEEMLLFRNDCQCRCEQWLHSDACACIVHTSARTFGNTEIPGSVRRDSPPLIKAPRGGLDSTDKLIVRRTHFCSKSWLVPRANLVWAVSSSSPDRKCNCQSGRRDWDPILTEQTHSPHWRVYCYCGNLNPTPKLQRKEWEQGGHVLVWLKDKDQLLMHLGKEETGTRIDSQHLHCLKY